MEKVIAVLKESFAHEQKTDEHGKYVKVLNPHFNENPFPTTKNISQFSRATFHGYIADAFDCVKKGLGDSITINAHNRFDIEVRKHLDESVSESLRQKTIEGFKDANFVWVIRVYKNSLSSLLHHRLVTDSLQMVNRLRGKHPVMFKSPTDAYWWMDMYIRCALKAAKIITSKATYKEQCNAFGTIVEGYNNIGIGYGFQYILFDFIEEEAKKEFRMRPDIDTSNPNKYHYVPNYYAKKYGMSISVPTHPIQNSDWLRGVVVEFVQDITDKGEFPIEFDEPLNYDSPIVLNPNAEKIMKMLDTYDRQRSE